MSSYPAEILRKIGLLQRYLIFACLILFATACTASDKPAPPGFLEGHLSIISLNPVEPGDGELPTVTPETFANYPLVVLSEDRKQEIAQFSADAKGDYRIALPPGVYVLDIQDRARKHVRAVPRSFTVVSNHTVHLNMEMDTGVR